MDKTTRWKDNELKDVDKAINQICDITKFEQENFNTWKECIFEKAFEENKSITLNGNHIEYNYIEGSYLEIKRNSDPMRMKLKIVVYSNSDSVFYIINRNSDALLILRKLLGYSGKNEIESKMPEVTDDFLFWLLNKIYGSNEPIETSSSDLKTLYLESIKRFSGDSQDLQTKVTARGESVMNLVSSLAFFLESQRLRNIKMELSYGINYNINLSFINRTNTNSQGTSSIGIDLNEYIGELSSIDENDFIPQLYLIIYLEIVPILFGTYEMEIESDEWNNKAYRNFFKEIGNEINHRIANLLGEFDDKIENKAD